MKTMEAESIDLVVTDPPYGIGFMGKEWDKAIPSVDVWSECLRLLKPGAFAFVMCIPRQDCLSRMIISLEDAGFMVNFSPIYWAYASGFPKAQNIGKAVDKRLGAEREVVGRWKGTYPDNPQSGGEQQCCGIWRAERDNSHLNITIPATPQAQALDGSYAGFQPKPAVEVILVAMKPLSEKTYVDQALKNGKGITWLDGGRIPYGEETDKRVGTDATAEGFNTGAVNFGINPRGKGISMYKDQGRYPANLLVSDDVLNDGRVTGAGITGSGTARRGNQKKPSYFNPIKPIDDLGYNDSGSFSRYFDLDKWAQKTFPFLIVPKASKSEKNRGCEGFFWLDGKRIDSELYHRLEEENRHLPRNKRHKIAWGNIHPTCKPIKLMAYLITLGSREGDVVLDPFAGSGPTGVACKELNRDCIMIEIDPDYVEIEKKRLEAAWI